MALRKVRRPTVTRSWSGTVCSEPNARWMADCAVMQLVPAVSSQPLSCGARLSAELSLEDGGRCETAHSSLMRSGFVEIRAQPSAQCGGVGMQEPCRTDRPTAHHAGPGRMDSGELFETWRRFRFSDHQWPERVKTIRRCGSYSKALTVKSRRAAASVTDMPRSGAVKSTMPGAGLAVSRRGTFPLDQGSVTSPGLLTLRTPDCQPASSTWSPRPAGSISQIGRCTSMSRNPWGHAGGSVSDN